MFPVLLLVLNLLFSVTVTQSASVRQRNVRSNENRELVIEIEDENKAQYLEQNFDTNSYRFGYEIGSDGQFHHENRGPDSITYGCYGHIDPNRNLQATHYVADSYGYRVVEPNHPIVTYHAADESDAVGKAKRQVRSWSESHFPKGCGSQGSASKYLSAGHEVGGIGQSNRPNPIALDVYGKPVSFDSNENAAALPPIAFNRNLNTITTSHRFVRVNSTESADNGNGNLAHYPIKKIHKSKTSTYHRYSQKKPFVSASLSSNFAATSAGQSSSSFTSGFAAGTSFKKTGVHQVEVESNYQTGAGITTSSSSFGDRLPTPNKRKNNILSILADSEDDSTGGRKTYSNNVVVLTGHNFEKTATSAGQSDANKVNSDDRERPTNGLETAYQFSNNGKFEFSKTNPGKVHLNRLSNDDFTLTKKVNKDEFWNNNDIFKKKVVVVKKVVPRPSTDRTLFNDVHSSATEIVKIGDDQERPATANGIETTTASIGQHDADGNYSISVENGVLVFKNIQNIAQSVLDGIHSKKEVAASGDADDRKTESIAGNFEQDSEDAIRNQNQVPGLSITNEYLPQFETRPEKANGFVVGDEHSYSLVSDKNGETKYESATTSSGTDDSSAEDYGDGKDDDDDDDENSNIFDFINKFDFVKLKPPKPSGTVYLGNDVRLETSFAKNLTTNPYAEQTGNEDKKFMKLQDKVEKDESQGENDGTDALNSLSNAVESHDVGNSEGGDAVSGNYVGTTLDHADNGLEGNQIGGSQGNGDWHYGHGAGVWIGAGVHSNSKLSGDKISGAGDFGLNQSSDNKVSSDQVGQSQSGGIGGHHGIRLDQTAHADSHLGQSQSSGSSGATGVVNSHSHTQNGIRLDQTSGGNAGFNANSNLNSQTSVIHTYEHGQSVSSSGSGILADNKFSTSHTGVLDSDQSVGTDDHADSHRYQSQSFGSSGAAEIVNSHSHHGIALDQTSGSSADFNANSNLNSQTSVINGYEHSQSTSSGGTGALADTKFITSHTGVLSNGQSVGIRDHADSHRDQSQSIGATGVINRHSQNGIALDQTSGINTGFDANSILNSQTGVINGYKDGQSGVSGGVADNSFSTSHTSGYEHGQSIGSVGSGVLADNKFSTSHTSGYEHGQSVGTDSHFVKGQSTGSSGDNGFVNSHSQNGIALDQTSGSGGGFNANSNLNSQTSVIHGFELGQSIGGGGGGGVDSGVLADNKFTTSHKSGYEHGQSIGSGDSGAIADNKFSTIHTSGYEHGGSNVLADNKFSTIHKSGYGNKGQIVITGVHSDSHIGNSYEQSQSTGNTGSSGIVDSHTNHEITQDQTSGSITNINANSNFNSHNHGHEHSQSDGSGAKGIPNGNSGAYGIVNSHTNHGTALDQTSGSSANLNSNANFNSYEHGQSVGNGGFGILADNKFSTSHTSGYGNKGQIVSTGVHADSHIGNSYEQIQSTGNTGASGIVDSHTHHGTALDQTSGNFNSYEHGQSGVSSAHASTVYNSDGKNIDNSQSSYTKFEHVDDGLIANTLTDKIKDDDKIVTIDKWFDSKKETTTKPDQEPNKVHVIDDKQELQQQHAQHEMKAQCNVLCLQQNYAYSNRTTLWNYLHDLTNIKSNQTEFETIQRTIILQPVVLLPYCASVFDNNFRILDFNTFLPLLQNQSYAKIPYKCANCSAKL